MIPKIIHYCWLSGDAYPEKIQYCINSWKKIIPDYEFVLWDTNRFPLDSCQWVKEAFEAKKYAFAADYIRLYAVYNYGGIYLDSDVEVFKRFDNLLRLPYFIGHEGSEDCVEIAAFGAEKGIPWIKDCLDYYSGRHFKRDDGSFDIRVLPNIVHDIISEKYQIKNISRIEDFEYNSNILNVFPKDWFCANVHINTYDIEPTYIISKSSYCVHHFANSWCKKESKLKQLMVKALSKIGIVWNHKKEEWIVYKPEAKNFIREKIVKLLQYYHNKYSA
jgi:hypothetical protein